jgi:hypothetical protein
MIRDGQRELAVERCQAHPSIFEWRLSPFATVLTLPTNWWNLYPRIGQLWTTNTAATRSGQESRRDLCPSDEGYNIHPRYLVIEERVDARKTGLLFFFFALRRVGSIRTSRLGWVKYYLDAGQGHEFYYGNQFARIQTAYDNLTLA